MRRPLTHLSLLTLLALAAGSVACSRGNRDLGAIESLKEPTLSSDYDAAFWADQAAVDSKTWHQAVEICRAEADQRHPNCAVVLSTAFIQGLEKATDRPFPEYGVGSGSTGVPEGLQDPPKSESDSEDRSSDKPGDG